MSEYNRYTTQKGQLLLNIKPPSRTNQSSTTPQQPSTTGYTNNSRNIPYSTVNRSYNNPPSNQSNGFVISSPDNTRIQPIGNSRQIYNENTQNLSNYNPIPNQVYSNYTNPYQTPYSVIPQQFHQQSPIRKVVDQPKSTANDYDYIGEADSDNSQKRGIKKAETICCFPAYWLVCLLLSVVLLSFFLILMKSLQDKAAPNNTNSPTINSTKTNATTNSSTPSSPSSENSKIPSSPTINNKNQPNTTFKFGPQSYLQPIYIPPIDTSYKFPTTPVTTNTTITTPTTPKQATNTNTNNVIYLQPVPASEHNLGEPQNLRHRELLNLNKS